MVAARRHSGPSWGSSERRGYEGSRWRPRSTRSARGAAAVTESASAGRPPVSVALKAVSAAAHRRALARAPVAAKAAAHRPDAVAAAVELRVAAIAALLALASCGREAAPAADASADPASAPAASAASNADATPGRPASDVDRAVVVATGLQLRPESADSILAAHAFTIESFEALMLRIASDSTMSAEYLRRVGGGP